MPTYEFLQVSGPATPASGDKPSRSEAYRHAKHADPPRNAEAKTLYEVFENSVKKFPNEPCLGHRPVSKDGVAGDFTFLTYQEVADKVKAFATSLAAAGLKKGDRVAVFGANCSEWMIAMQACNRMSYECVPLYDTLGENAIEYIIDHSESVFLVVSSSKLPNFCAALPKISATLKGVVYWGTEAKAEHLDTVSQRSIAPTPFDKFVTDGMANAAPAVPPAPGDLCTIMYTSGTTGDPKGVMLTHEAVVVCVDSLKAFLKDNNLEVDHRDGTLSYLPLAHIFDRTCEEMFLSIGGRIGYWQGKLPALVDDIGNLKPTIFIGVPRVFDKIYNGINDQISGAGCVKKFLFNFAYKAKLNKLKAGYSSAEAAKVWDKIVFSKMKARLGGEVRAIVSGGAPLAPHVEEFLKVCMCAPVVQGYGLTESCAASFIAVPDDPTQGGTVGPPLPVTEFCLESVPEMKYDAQGSTPEGELLVRGPNVFVGYYKADDKTEEVLEAEKWFHTGDVAQIQPNGSIKIIDRKKNIFKLAQGEYIAVEKLEGEYKKCSYVNQIFVYGNSFESSLVAIVVPKEEALKDWASSHSQGSASFEELCKKPEAKQFILQALTEQAKLSKLRGFEFIKSVHLDSEEFSVENDTLTPTFKLRRPQLKDRYNSVIDDMYKAQKG